MNLQDIRHLFDYTEWANDLAMEAADELPDADLHRGTGISHGSIFGTLTHMAGAEWIWLERWTGRSPAKAEAWTMWTPESCGDLATLNDRWQDVGEVRVPESQVERALALLPAIDPAQIEEVERCAWCGSKDARVVAPFTTVLASAGAAVVAWEIYSRRFEAAVAAAFLALLVVAMTKMAAGRLVCTNCGREWRAPRAAPDPSDLED